MVELGSENTVMKKGPWRNCQLFEKLSEILTFILETWMLAKLSSAMLLHGEI